MKLIEIIALFAAGMLLLDGLVDFTLALKERGRTKAQENEKGHVTP